MSPHYGHAPITEAVLDVRVRFSGPVSLQKLETVQSAFAAAYPTRRNRITVQGELLAGDQVTTSTSQRQVGYAFLSEDERQVFQATTEGFAFSRLAPYEDWTSFAAEAKRLWEAYRSTVDPAGIDRLGLRYINRLDLPLPLEDFSEYLRTLPEVSADLPQGLAGYFMRLEIPQPDEITNVVLTQALLPMQTPSAASILLDIDVYRTTSENDESAIWNCFEDLHVQKNHVFEACITDKTRELIR